MSTRFISISLLLATALAPLGAGATEYVVNGIRYDCTGAGNSAKATILPATASDSPYAGDITIPATIDANGKTYNVKAAKREAFANSAELTSVALPAGMTDLGMSCFEGCTKLTSVTLPTEASMLPQYLFKDCAALESIVIPDNFSTLQGNVFEGCTSLKSVTLSKTSYLLGANFFKGCTALESVEIPDNYTLLGVNVFEGCTSLKNVTLPQATTSIQDNFFKDCSALETYVLPAALKTVGKTAFAGCAALKWVEFTNQQAATLKDGAFDQAFMETGFFYVPDDAVDAYKASLTGAVNVLPVSERKEEPVEPVEEWISRGEATFFDPWICSVFKEPRYSWKVEVEESSTRPGYFRMKNPYLNGKCPMFMAPTHEGNDVYINACDPKGVFIESQGLGFTPNSSVAPEFLISSVAGRHQENGLQSLEEDKKQGLTGFYNEGIIQIPAAGMLWSFPPYTDEDYYWCKYDFELRFPEAIVYEISSEVLCLDEYYLNLWKECLKPGESVPVEVTAPDCVAQIKYGVIPGVEMPTAAELAAIAAGDKVAQKGRNDFSVPDNYVGRMSLIFAALDAEGNVRATCRSLFDVINEDLYGPWKSLGWTRFADVVILANYGAQTEPYAVEVEESTTSPGLYRVKNAYSTRGYWTSGEGNLHHHDDENHYLYINAEDPDAVYVMPSPVGFKSNEGSMLMTSPVAVNLSYGYTLDELKQLSADMLGTLREGVITIPDGAIYASETRYQGGEYYPGNPGLEFRMTLPGYVAIESVDAESGETQARYFNLQGAEIANPAPGTPVIELRGNRATKIIR